MTEKPIRIGIIGAGENTKSRHIPGFKKIKNVEIAAICNSTPESTQKAARALRIPLAFNHWSELVASPDIQAVVIGTWPNMHFPATMAALNADKHVLCEARMAMNAKEAQIMRDTARQKPHLVTQIVPAPFSLSHDDAIKRILAEGHIGTPLVVTVHDGNDFINREQKITWREDIDKSGYNTMSLGIWYETVMRWLGPAVRVTAMGKIFVKTRQNENEELQSIQIPDHLNVIADMACGAQAHFHISKVTGLAGESGVCIYGDNGTLKFSGNRIYGAQKKTAKFKEIKIPPEMIGVWRVEEEFINAIRGMEKIKHTTFEDACKYMEFTQAVMDSIKTGKTVSLPL